MLRWKNIVSVASLGFCLVCSIARASECVVAIQVWDEPNGHFTTAFVPVSQAGNRPSEPVVATQVWDEPNGHFTTSFVPASQAGNRPSEPVVAKQVWDEPNGHFITVIVPASQDEHSQTICPTLGKKNYSPFLTR